MFSGKDESIDVFIVELGWMKLLSSYVSNISKSEAKSNLFLFLCLSSIDFLCSLFWIVFMSNWLFISLSLTVLDSINIASFFICVISDFWFLTSFSSWISFGFFIYCPINFWPIIIKNLLSNFFGLGFFSSFFVFVSLLLLKFKFGNIAERRLLAGSGFCLSIPGFLNSFSFLSFTVSFIILSFFLFVSWISSLFISFSFVITFIFSWFSIFLFSSSLFIFKHNSIFSSVFSSIFFCMLSSLLLSFFSSFSSSFSIFSSFSCWLGPLLSSLLKSSFFSSFIISLFSWFLLSLDSLFVSFWLSSFSSWFVLSLICSSFSSVFWLSSSITLFS